jgi:hypothetical protein
LLPPYRAYRIRQRGLILAIFVKRGVSYDMSLTYQMTRRLTPLIVQLTARNTWRVCNQLHDPQTQPAPCRLQAYMREAMYYINRERRRPGL